MELSARVVRRPVRDASLRRTDTFERTEPTMSASRSVARASARGRRTPLKKAAGLYSAFLSARYKWKLSRLCAAMSSWTAGSSTRE